MGIKKRVARSSSLPLLALRGLVVFPGMLLHFDVGRQKSIQALNASMGADQIIYLVTQRDVAQDDPSVEGLYTVGVVAKVRQVLKLPGGQPPYSGRRTVPRWRRGSASDGAFFDGGCA